MDPNHKSDPSDSGSEITKYLLATNFAKGLTDKNELTYKEVSVIVGYVGAAKVVEYFTDLSPKGVSPKKQDDKTKKTMQAAW